MSEQKILSVIIVTWNTKTLVNECIDSIFALPEYSDSVEIIVIDNGSTDGTDKLISEKYKEIVYIRNNDNVGYAPAVNQGVKIAEGKYVLLLGSDTVLKPNSLKRCISFLDENNNAGAVGCKLVFPDGSPQGNCKKFPTLRNGFFTYLSLDKLNHDYDMLWFNYDKTIKVDQIATTFLMIKGDLIKKLGGFDERYKILYNDVDLCKRIWNENKEIYFLHDAEVIHHGSYSTKKARYQVRRIMYDDIYRYYRTKFGRKSILLLPVLKLRLFLTVLFKK
jgi:GT2 family glycosyltransferase